MSDPAFITRLARIDQRYPFGTTLALTYLGIIFACLPNLADPFVRHDDFPPLLLRPDLYYSKTLSEGRWINYLWHFRPFPTPAWLNLAIYNLTAAIICTGLAVAALGRESGMWYRVALAVFAWLGAPHFLISQWYHTYMLGMALVALYAWLATVCSERQTRLLLIPFVPLTFMAYPTYPVVLLAFCLTRHDGQRSFLDGLRLMLLFIVCYAAAVLMTFAINYVFHGVFGVEVAQWREGNPLRDWASFVVNLRRVWEFGESLRTTLGFRLPYLGELHIVLFALSIYYIARQDFWRGMYIFVGMLAGLCLLALQAITSGAFLPARIFGFGWMFYALALVLFVQMLAARGGVVKQLGVNLLRILVTLHMLAFLLQGAKFGPWQADTRALAARIGEGPEPVYLIGTDKDLPSSQGANILYPYGLKWRLAYLTRRDVYLCSYYLAIRPTDPCEGFDPLLEDERRVNGRSIVEHLSDHVIVILPRRTAGRED